MLNFLFWLQKLIYTRLYLCHVIMQIADYCRFHQPRLIPLPTRIRLLRSTYLLNTQDLIPNNWIGHVSYLTNVSYFQLYPWCPTGTLENNKRWKLKNIKLSLFLCIMDYKNRQKNIILKVKFFPYTVEIETCIRTVFYLLLFLCTEVDIKGKNGDCDYGHLSTQWKNTIQYARRNKRSYFGVRRNV